MSKRITITMDDKMFERLAIQSEIKGYGKSRGSVVSLVYEMIVRHIFYYESRENGIELTGDGGSVYVVQAGDNGPVKIGFSKLSGLEKRIGALQVGCPYEIKLLYLLPDCSMELEHRLHILYRDYHMRGEWFESSVLKKFERDMKASKTKFIAYGKQIA
jgi:hypothetical protein